MIKYIVFIFLIVMTNVNCFSENNVDFHKKQFDQLLNTDVNKLYTSAAELKQNAVKNGNLLEKAIADMYIGMYYSRMTIYNKALTSYFSALNGFQSVGNTAFLGQLYSSIGATYRHLKEFEKAKQFAEMAYSNSMNAGNKVKAKILNRIGDMHRDLGNIDSAFSFYRRSLAITDESNIESFGDNYNNIGDLFRALGNYDSSSYYYKKSISYLEKGDDLDELAENFTSLAELNLQFQNYEQAIYNIEKAVEILENIPPGYELNNAYSSAIAIYKATNRQDLLNVYLIKLLQLERKTASEQLDKTVTAVELEQSIKNKDMQYELLEKQSKLKDLTNTLLIAVVILVIFIGLLLWRQIRRKRIENKTLAEQKEAILQAKEELQWAFDDIHELNATKDKFFSIIAHDLRNPLGSFKMVINLLNDSYDDLSSDEKKEFLVMLKDSSDNLYSLLENLLEWSRSQRGKIDFSPNNTNLRLLADNTIQMLATSASNKQIKLMNHIENDFIVFADENLLSTVVRNIISNAIKFTPENGVVTIEASSQSEEFDKIIIADTGVGIPKENLGKIFRLDSNISTKGTSNESGTGLGLILCKEFIEKHSGKIHIESEVGKGSTFIIDIPKKLSLPSP